MPVVIHETPLYVDDEAEFDKIIAVSDQLTVDVYELYHDITGPEAAWPDTYHFDDTLVYSSGVQTRIGVKDPLGGGQMKWTYTYAVS
jgi:hypothetical protein